MIKKFSIFLMLFSLIAKNIAYSEEVLLPMEKTLESDPLSQAPEYPLPSGCVYIPNCDPFPPPPPPPQGECPIPPGGCYPYNKCDPNINPYAPPPEGVCCPSAPIRKAHWGLNAAVMILPIALIVGIAAIILTESSRTK